MAKVPKFKFKWDPKDNRNYGVTYHYGSRENWNRMLKGTGIRIPKK